MEEYVYLGTEGTSAACKRCYVVFRVGKLMRGPACARCKRRNTCKPCMKKVLLKTLGEKEVKLVCEDCLYAYKDVCDLVKERNNWD